LPEQIVDSCNFYFHRTFLNKKLILADFSSSCGDGIIFNKKAGFEVKGTKAISPYFKVFKLIEATGNTAAVKYRCSFTTCNNTCDGVRNFIKSIFFY
jgi:hypothetical protein